MKKILFLVSSMEGGGAERVAALLSNCWVEKGYRVTLMPTFSGRGECHYYLDGKVTLDYLADRVGFTHKSFFNKLKRLLALRRAIQDHKPDIIVSFFPLVSIAAIVATLRIKVPVVVSERVYPPSVPLKRVDSILRKWAYRRAGAVVLQTGQGLHWLESCCKYSKGIVIPNPVIWPLPESASTVDPEFFFRNKSKILLSIGRLNRQKGHDCLLKAFSHLSIHFPDWSLVIVGDGEERAPLEAMCEQLNLCGRVYFPGRVGNISAWYGKAELYVMSSRFEGFPNTLTEAMAHGLPAVSFDCDTGPRDIIRHGVDGLLVDPSLGVEGLVRALSQLMNDETTRKSMGERAKDVRLRFSMESVAKLWDEVLGLQQR